MRTVRPLGKANRDGREKRPVSSRRIAGPGRPRRDASRWRCDSFERV